jgi:HAE1 family hydrophobic/amphiphilic exporter-1
MSIYKTAVSRPITTLLVFVAVIIFGVYSYVNLPVDLYPSMDIPAITVYSAYPGASAEDIESNVTEPIEDALNGVDNLKEISSVSKDNISIVTLEFEWGNNLDEAANDIRDALGFVQSRLPDEMEDPVIYKFNSSDMPILFLSISAEESYPGLTKILENRLLNPLKRVDGIASAAIVGHPGREIYVEVDPVKMEAYNLTLEQIGDVIKMENMDLPSGNVEMGKMNFPMRVVGEFTESREISDLRIGTYSGQTIYLRDVAVVTDTLRDVNMFLRNDGHVGARMMVTKQSGANTVEVAQQVHKKLAEIEPTLPEDITLNIIYDSSEFVQGSVDNLTQTIAYAIIFVVVVVLFFLGRWRSTFIVAITIPVSLIVSFIYLGITGESINIISMSAISIALGMVVDDAIVVLENISRHIERGNKPREAAIYATNEVWLSVIATTLTVAAIFVPLTMIGGDVGILFKQLGWIVTITVVTSTIAAITLVPMLSSKLLKLQEDTGKKKPFYHYDRTILPMLNKLDDGYAKVLRWTLSHKTVVLLTLLVMFVAIFSLFPKIGTEFMPNTDQNSLTIGIELQEGTRAEETYKFSIRMDSMLMANYGKEIEIISTNAGADDEGGGVVDMMQETGHHRINYSIGLVNASERDRSVFEIAEDLRIRLDEFPEITNYETSTNAGAGSMGSTKLEVEIYGYDFDQTNSLALEVQALMQEVEGAQEVLISRDRDKPELQIELDQDKLVKHNLNNLMVASAVRNRINGLEVSKLREDGEEYDIVVRLKKDARNSISDIENLSITTPTGQIVKLRELGEVSEYWSTPNIQRKSQSRYLIVSAVPNGVSLGQLAEDVEAKLKDLDIPEDITMEVGGAFKDQQESFADLGLLMILGIVLVYIVMASQFESFTMPLIIMFSIPFSFAGVVLALYLTNTNLSVIAALGAIVLVGIVVKNGIVLVDYINLMRERGVELYEAIVSAGKSRLRPVLMTAFTTILSMLPMALSQGEGSEIWTPMGIAVIGGLTFSTLITLLIVPIAYALMAKSGARDKKKKIQKEFSFIEG